MSGANTYSIGRLFRIARILAGKSLRETSKATGIRTVRLSDIELGHRLPSDEEADALGDFYYPRKALDLLDLSGDQ